MQYLIKIEFSSAIFYNNTMNKQNRMNHASEIGDIKLIENLLKQGENVDETDINGKTPLMYASYNGHLETVQFLLDHKSQINMKTGWGYTALNDALLAGHSEIAEALLKQGANPNQIDYLGNNSLQFLFNLDHFDESIANLLIQKVDLKHKNYQNRNALMVYLTRQERETLSINKISPDYDTYPNLLRKLIKNQTNLDDTDNNGLSAVDMAYQNGNFNFISLLMKNGAKNYKLFNENDLKNSLPDSARKFDLTLRFVNSVSVPASLEKKYHKIIEQLSPDHEIYIIILLSEILEFLSRKGPVGFSCLEFSKDDLMGSCCIDWSLSNEMCLIRRIVKNNVNSELLKMVIKQNDFLQEGLPPGQKILWNFQNGMSHFSGEITITGISEQEEKKIVQSTLLLYSDVIWLRKNHRFQFL